MCGLLNTRQFTVGIGSKGLRHSWPLTWLQQESFVRGCDHAWSHRAVAMLLLALQIPCKGQSGHVRFAHEGIPTHADMLQQHTSLQFRLLPGRHFVETSVENEV